MTHAQLVFEHLKHLPESGAAEVLDFVKFLEQEPGCTGIRPATPTRQRARPGVDGRGLRRSVRRFSGTINEPTAHRSGDLADHPSQNY